MDFYNNSNGRYVLVDKATGEEMSIDMYVDTSNDGAIEHYASILENYINIGGTNTHKVLVHFLTIKTNDNIINGTVRELASKLDVSSMTVGRVIKAMQNKDLLTKVRSGCYMLSPYMLKDDVVIEGVAMINLWRNP